MMNRPRDRIRAFLLLTASVVTLAAPAVSAGAEVAKLTRAERRELWAKNMAQIEHLRQTPFPGKPVDVPEGTASGTESRVRKWLNTHRKQLAEMTAAIRRDYDWYVEQAKTHLSKGEIREALFRATNALDNAPDKEALLASDWVRKLEREAVALAKKYREKSDWRRAHGVYYELTTLFENREEYEKGREECLNIARLNVLYGDAKRWPEVLEGVDPQNATDALDRIERFYVEEARFKDITEAGLERLLLLGESEKMRETFEGLADDGLREEFDTRIRARLARVRRSDDDRFRANDAKFHFRRVLTINEETVRLPEELIVYEFLNGALEPLDDFTSVIWPIEFREFDKHTRGGFVGVGISIRGGGEFPVTVVSPLEDTPAYRAGILPEDEITHVDGESIEGLSLNKVVQKITGPMNTTVTLTIYRPSEKKSFDMPLVRAQVELISVKGFQRRADDPEQWDFMIDRDMGIGYARVNSFQENTVEQLRAAIEDMVANGARAMILDLRFNPGGLMKAAIEMAQLFLKRDDLIVSTRGLHDAPWQNPKPPRDGPYTALPLVVLVNEFSASASEIVSGALQDHQRAVIVGERTFGKFSVQKLMQLSGGMAHLKLTTARYYLPSGRWLHHEKGATEWGVHPDSAYETVPKELRKIQQLWRDADILGQAGDASEAEGDSKGDADGKGDAGAADAKEKDAVTTERHADEQPDAADAKADADTLAGADADDKDADADTDADDDEDSDELALEPDVTEPPDVDLQLESALLLMRLHLLGEQELRVAAAQRDAPPSHAVRNP